MKKVALFSWGRIFLSLLAAAILFEGISSYKSNQVYADTTGWVDAAVDAKDTTTIISDLMHAKAGLVKWHATSGNAYLTSGTPASDMAEVNKNLDTYIVRATELNNLNHSSAEYQSGLSDLNNSFSYLYLYADDHWLRHQGFLLFITSQLYILAAGVSLIAMIAYSIVRRRGGADKK